MNHKLQFPSFTNDGSKTVGRTDSTSEIASNDADLELRAVADCVPDADSSRDSQLSGTAGSAATNELDHGDRSIAEISLGEKISTVLITASVVQPPSAVLPSETNVPSEPDDSNQTFGWERTEPQGIEVRDRAQPGAAVPQPSALLSQPRCEVARSIGWDPTGEYSVPCAALAQVVCEYCGPMCSSCAEETFCFQGEHKLTSLPDDGPLPEKRKRRGPVVEVVYVEIRCPNCRRVRLALPKQHRPKAVRKCPICKARGKSEYLAHGFTRRRLPYYEVFTEEKELPEGVEFKKRTPWDRRPNWWVEE